MKRRIAILLSLASLVPQTLWAQEAKPIDAAPLYNERCAAGQLRIFFVD